MTKEDRLYLRRVVPITESGGRPYSVRIDSVPMPWRGMLQEHIRCESIPIFSEGIDDCIYAWDWADWLVDRLHCPF